VGTDDDYRIGGPEQVRWITDGVDELGVTVTVAIPPVFAAYATVVIPGEGEDESHVTAAKHAYDAALLAVLRRHTAPQRWWLGYLETGVADVVFPDAARTTLHSWPYVLVEAGPAEAALWRTDEPRTAERFHRAGEHRWPATRWTPWHSALPELMFPADRSWLVSTLWDDDWTCVGGSADLVADLVRTPGLTAREVTTGEDCLPPGHVRD
jgi:hypothetical protein